MVLPNPVMLQKDKREEEETITHKSVREKKQTQSLVISDSRDRLPREGWICSTGVALLEMRNISCDKQAPTGKGFDRL